MSTLQFTAPAIRQEVVKVISTLKNIKPQRLVAINDLTELGFDILDVVEIILRLEKKYELTIPDDVPVYSVDDFVDFIYNYKLYNKAS
ncbi:acyl carrier protein [Pontibacter aydingkolensis]|uniref:Acyl carrier protein n=1 Tax=Pontibacter aydingkolensis TaxID=1911536 RepID=A0ABS7CSD4_9BACT|nr:acyl carrier protein [Pontibacter aydingkolensis]MBW7466695.1 acyl carrier protein [Pontibacter aydingkolensis]